MHYFNITQPEDLEPLPDEDHFEGEFLCDLCGESHDNPPMGCGQARICNRCLVEQFGDPEIISDPDI